MGEGGFALEMIDLTARLGMAALAGSAIGFERDIHGRAAGLRTHLLVCLGSALFMLISIDLGTSTGFTSDPARIAAQIVTGIGFLGAGVVLKHGVNVRGLTTAACLWVTAAIGMASGAGMFFLASTVTAVTVVSLTLLNSLERSFTRDNYRTIRLQTDSHVDPGKVLDTVRMAGVVIMACDMDFNLKDEKLLLDIDVKMHHKGTTDPIAGMVLTLLRESGLRLDRFTWHR